VKCHRHGQACLLRRDLCRVEVFDRAECERDVFANAAKKSETLVFNQATSYTEHRRKAPRNCIYALGVARVDHDRKAEVRVNSIASAGPMAIGQMFFRDVAVSAGEADVFSSVVNEGTRDRGSSELRHSSQRSMPHPRKTRT